MYITTQLIPWIIFYRTRVVWFSLAFQINFNGNKPTTSRVIRDRLKWYFIIWCLLILVRYVHTAALLSTTYLEKPMQLFWVPAKMTTFKDNNKSKSTGDEHGRESLACPFPPLNLQRKGERFMPTDVNLCHQTGSAQVPSCCWRSCLTQLHIFQILRFIGTAGASSH